MQDFEYEETTDHDEYFWFTGKSRLSRDMHILHGYVQGIAADSRINDLEIKSLMKWLSAHREFSDRHPFNEVVPRVEQIVSDQIVDEEERADLLWLSHKFSTDDGYYDDVTSEMQRLQGLLAGVLSDGKITAGELKALTTWVEERAYLKRCWPYDELDSIISHVMRDGRLDAQEHEALVQFFGEFVSANERKAVGALERDVTVSGVCAREPEITFDNCGFCFTGASKHGTRDYLASIVMQRGGEFHKNLRNDTDFLVVGANGNPCWAFACYGRKVEEAVERRRNGQRILIVHEFDFWEATGSPAA
jgi:hypothetical protein